MSRADVDSTEPIPRRFRSAASLPWPARGKEYNRGWPINFKPYAARVADGPTLVSDEDLAKQKLSTT